MKTETSADSEYEGIAEHTHLVELPDLVGTKLPGTDYTVVREIARDGMCGVYEGKDPSSCRVAIKVYPLSKKRFSSREAYIGNNIHHPAIAKVFQHAQLASGHQFIVMEYVDGETLAKLISRYNGAIEYSDAIIIGHRLASVMDIVHNKGIIHLDLKPSNIMLLNGIDIPLTDRIKLLDFGLAQILDSHIDSTPVHWTRSDSTTGTPAYRPPERLIRGTGSHKHSDVYSLGIMLYELLVGFPPFTGDVDSQIREVQPRPIKFINNKISNAVSSLLERMLAKVPKERPPMKEVASILLEESKTAPRAEPFPGLRPFCMADARYYCGRTDDKSHVLKLLHENPQTNWLHIEGAQAIGKSSFMCSGVLPMLARRQDPIGTGALARCVTSVYRPGEHPLINLAAALQSIMFEFSQKYILDKLTTNDNALSALIAEWRSERRESRLVLAFDQIEELFDADAQEILRIDRLLASALVEGRTSFMLITTIRNEHISKLVSLFPELSGLLSQATHYVLGKLKRSNWQQVIAEPLERSGLRCLPDLANQFASDALLAGGSLPLAAYALKRLWGSCAGTRLSLEQYRQIGGVSTALSLAADRTIQGLSGTQMEVAKVILTRLAVQEPQHFDGSSALTWTEVVRMAGGTGPAEKLVCQLSGKPNHNDSGEILLPLIEVSTGPTRHVRLAHAAILEHWTMLQDWVAEYRPLWKRASVMEMLAGANIAPAPHSLLDFSQGSDLAPPATHRLPRLYSERVQSFLQKLRTSFHNFANQNSQFNEIQVEVRLLKSKEQEIAAQLTIVREQYGSELACIRNTHAQELEKLKKGYNRELEKLQTKLLQTDTQHGAQPSRFFWVRLILMIIGGTTLAIVSIFGLFVLVYSLKYTSAKLPQSATRNSPEQRVVLPTPPPPRLATSPAATAQQPPAPPRPVTPANLVASLPTPAAPSPPPVGTARTFDGTPMVLIAKARLGQPAIKTNNVVPFWLDKTEVTTAAYKECVDKKKCTININAIKSEVLRKRCNWSYLVERGNHPINCVTQFEASVYCSWRKARLPTDPEWMLAALGLDERTHPWGTAPPQTKQLCWANREKSCSVLEKTDDISAFGILNMGANVAEWTDTDHPLFNGPKSFRGGNFSMEKFHLEPKTKNAVPLDPTTERQNTLGFRCARTLMAEDYRVSTPERGPPGGTGH